MTLSTAARLWWGATALAVVVALAIQVPLSAGATDDASFPTPLSRVLNLFVFFTIWSNILVAVVAAGSALGRDLDQVAWRAARLAGLVAITVTFAVYNVVLREPAEPGPGAVANELFHIVVPVLTVVGWVAFGPRGRTSWPVVLWSLALPVPWTVLTLVRGAVVDGWYPYPFLDVTGLGYPTVLLNVAIVGIAFLALAAGAHLGDRALRRAASPQRAAGDPGDRAAT
ncbi:MAG: Pr6Pr family membrane protein [Kineosporiaceae bacterium]